MNENELRSAVVRKKPEPFDEHELAAVWSHPVKLVDLVLSAPERVAVNLERGRSLGALALALFAASVAFAIPYGLVHDSLAWWRVIALYLGSTLICLPSLYVFTSYLGVRVTLAQVAVLALTIPAVAALFTFGFAPILGFLRATMDEHSKQISWRSISVVLLTSALFAGIGQLWRCMLSSEQMAARRPLWIVLLGWHAVFLHVLLRMASVLGLDG